MPDPLGSTTALLDSSQNITDTWEYWPYGEVASRTGSNSTPFTFCGIWGYFKDLVDRLLYVRARFLEPNLGRWLTVDPLWPKEPAYTYAKSTPTVRIDPSGVIPVIPVCVGACVLCGPCLIDMLIVCPPNMEAEKWAKCVMDVWDQLNPWVKWPCTVICAGCIGCIVAWLARAAARACQRIVRRPPKAPKLPPGVSPCQEAIGFVIGRCVNAARDRIGCIRHCTHECVSYATPFGPACENECAATAALACTIRW